MSIEAKGPRPVGHEVAVQYRFPSRDYSRRQKPLVRQRAEEFDSRTSRANKSGGQHRLGLVLLAALLHPACEASANNLARQAALLRA